MAVIVPKRKSVITKGTNYMFNPKTFDKEHTVETFYEVDTAEELLNMIRPFEYEGRKFIAFDTETMPLHLKSNEIPGNLVRRWVGTGKSAKPQDLPFCFSVYDGRIAITLYDSLDNIYREFKKLSALMEDESVEKIAHNWKFDAHMFANIGMSIKGKVHDTVVLTKLANENRYSFSLRDLAKKYPGHIIKYEYMVDAYKKTHKIATYDQIPRKLLSAYANADVLNCFVVFMNEYPILKRDNLEDLYETEMQLMLSLWSMERSGTCVDLDYEKPLKKELQDKTDTSEQAIYDCAGKIFNVNSSKQIYETFMNLGVDDSLIPRTDKGNPQTNKKVLQSLARRHKVNIAELILEYRKYEKLLTTYAVGIYDQRSAVGKVHCNINQTEATTGRMSITKPAQCLRASA